MPRVLCKTKHFQVAVKIREIANTLPPGAPLPVASELTERLSVSHGTVMQALRQLADDGVIVRPFGRKRYVISACNPGITHRICIIRPDFSSADLDNIIQQIYNEGSRNGWLFDHHFFKDWRGVDFATLSCTHDAVILLPPSEAMSADFMSALAKPRRPVLVLEQHLPDKSLLGVHVDDFRVGYLGAEALLKHGHRRIAFFKDQPSESTMTQRYAGFRAALTDYGIDWNEELLLDSRIISFQDSLTIGYNFLKERFAAEGIRFTGVFTASLSGGMSMLRALRERGISVPGEVGVVAYGGETSFCDYLNPALTSIDINAAEYGVRVVDLLTAVLQGKDPSCRQIALAPKLVLRDSL